MESIPAAVRIHDSSLSRGSLPGKLPSERLAAPHVLLVDDDEGLRQAVARGLAKAGYRVSVAADGREALERVREERPDAAVLDVLLPDSGGLGLAAEMRRIPGLGALPVLFVTALAPSAVGDTLFPSPVLFKPFSYRQLVAGVRTLLRGR
ncbi:MAG TPA: response regulator [Anaeromyxobacteraceae bacterium]|nr:response regulator [Anaeromyxobacteraceae bacterium]